MAIKFKIEYEIPQIRFVEVTCPSCNHEFDAMGNGNVDDGTEIHDVIDLKYAIFTCPECANTFRTRGEDVEIE
ncbi:hypothetical protein [Shouchella patagoniensis]|uniref:hypothetical protein n=1 Tax=Shouchella patagoniensis TaxID=228576 RepID=UPI000995026D|nr:hypothetical protein [Shouchella patagoniensis]